jgi:hypothetical protein
MHGAEQAKDTAFSAAGLGTRNKTWSSVAGEQRDDTTPMISWRILWAEPDLLLSRKQCGNTIDDALDGSPVHCSSSTHSQWLGTYPQE